MIHVDMIKKMLLQQEIGKRQMQKAAMFDVGRQQKGMQISQMMQQRAAQEQQMKLQQALKIDNLDTPVSRELFQVKQLLANRERPQMPAPMDMTTAFNEVLASKLMF